MKYTDPNSLSALQDAFDKITEAILWLQEIRSRSDDFSEKMIRKEIDGHLEAAQEAMQQLASDRQVNEIITTLRFMRKRITPYQAPFTDISLQAAILMLYAVLKRSLFTENLHP